MESIELINILRMNGFMFMENKYVLNLNHLYKKDDLLFYSVSQSVVKHCHSIEAMDGSIIKAMENEINDYLISKSIDEKFSFLIHSYNQEYNICQEFTTYQTDQRT